MSDAGLPALPRFLRLLSSLADPSAVASALVHGPLMGYRARAASIVQIDGDDFVTIARHGYPVDEPDRYAAVPLRLHVPFALAIRQDRIVASRGETLLQEYPLFSVDAGMWTDLMEGAPDAVLLSVPIAVEGLIVGAYGFVAEDPAAGTAGASAPLRGLGAALGLWMTHPRRVATQSHRTAGSGLSLTARQMSIVRAAGRGLGNATIALELGCSPDTVKADLQRAMRTLGVSSRHEVAARAEALGLLD